MTLGKVTGKNKECDSMVHLLTGAYLMAEGSKDSTLLPPAGKKVSFT